MKNKILIVSICLMFSMMTYSQTDSIYFIKKADFSFYKFKKVKFDNSSDIQTEKYLTSLQDVTRINILENDSAKLFNQDEIIAYTNLLNIDEVTKYKYRFSPVLGTFLGIIGGSAALAGIGYLIASNKPVGEGNMIFGGAFFGSILGGIVGAGIAYAINHPTLDLSSVPEKDKRNKLIKFLKEK